MFSYLVVGGFECPQLAKNISANVGDFVGVLRGFLELTVLELYNYRNSKFSLQLSFIYCDGY